MDNKNSKQEKRRLFDLFLSYSYADKEFAEALWLELTKRGVYTFFEYDLISAGEEYSTYIAETIKTTRCFVPIVSGNSINSSACTAELQFALECAVDRSKTIIPIILNYGILPYDLMRFQTIVVDRISKEEVSRVAEVLANYVNAEKNEVDNLDLLSRYIESGATNKATELLCKLISETIKRFDFEQSMGLQKEWLSQLISLLEKLVDIYDYDYGKEAKELAHRKQDVLNGIHMLLSSDISKSDDLFFISSVIRLYYYEREIRWACIDTTTHGDLSDGIIHPQNVSEDVYEEKQRPFVLKYDNELIVQSQDRYTEDEWQFVLSTLKYIYKPGKSSKTSKFRETKSIDDDLLIQVASFMREGNKIFDLISENQQAEEFIKCLILSYERLKQYCEVVGEKRVCAECIDRIHELNKKLAEGCVGNKSTVKARDGIKSLLGLTIPKSGKFDVFISHKSEDTDIASDMYFYLKRNMKEAFYDKETLPEMSESQYRKSIMRALDGSTHFVLILSDLSYIESYWVNLEMDIFQSEIDEGRKPNSNFIMVVTNKVFDEIMKSNKAALPIEYRRCEIMRVEEYKTKLLSYLSKK